MRWALVVMFLCGLAHAGPLTGVEHGFDEVSLFKNVALGPTLGASGLWERLGFGGRLSLGLGLAVFHSAAERHGALKFSALLEGELQLAPGTFEGTVVASASPVAWRWFSLGAFVGVGLKGRTVPDAWTIRVGPELTAKLHRSWGNFDGVAQVFVRGSFPLLRGDVFSSQVLLGVRFFIDLA
ncbi:MAG: hypothetical protein Q8S33_06345 [Myxococcales bacterium]|nr:hypothetical protein [Myxococcales bacterium]